MLPQRFRGWSTRMVLVVSLLCSAVVVTGVTADAAPRQATAQQQLRWVVSASAQLPVSTDELRQHFSAAFLQGVGGPDKLNQKLAQLSPLGIRQVLDRHPAKVQALVSGAHATYLAELEVDATGSIIHLVFGPYLPAPRSWSELDRRLHALAPQVSFVTSEIEPNGRCRMLHGDDAGTDRPLGSAFKLYVLGALGQAVADGRTSWNRQLAIHENWKSLPSGMLQNEPASTKFSLRQYANYMISISDNTAADHLIHFLGRNAVQEQLFRFGKHDPSMDIPFPTTRELFVLKGVRYPTLANGYLALPRPLRGATLDALDQIPRTRITPWTSPEKINQIEWFASPNDICRAYSGLLRENGKPVLSPIGDALSINDGAVGLSRTQYPMVWFKGGSEPGVLTLNYLARTADGRVLVDSLMLADPTTAFDDQTVTGELLALARGGIQLADHATAH